MGQLIATIISFMLIPILIKRKVKLSRALLSTTLILGILSGVGIQTLGEIILGIFTNPYSRDTILTVLIIGILGGLMKHYKILDQMVDTMFKIIRNKKVILMMIPALIGILIIPGGAILSAPFIYNIGEELKIPKPRRAAINLIFRHIAMLLLPFSSTLLFVHSSLPELNIYKVIMFNLIFIGGALPMAYFLYLKDIKIESHSKVEDMGKNILRLVVLSSPIYMPVIINLVTDISFYLTMIVSIVIVYLLGDKKNFLRVGKESLNWDTVITVASVLIMKDIILNMGGMLSMVDQLFLVINNHILILFILMLVSMFFGVITGYSTTGLAVTLPIVSMMNLPIDRLYVYVYFLIGSAFIGYYFSPLHLCQAFTTQEMGVSTGELYKEYKIYAIFLVLLLMGTTLGLLAITLK